MAVKEDGEEEEVEEAAAMMEREVKDEMVVDYWRFAQAQGVSLHITGRVESPVSRDWDPAQFDLQ